MKGKSTARHALLTKRAIENVDNFEHKWKIQTNKSKFQVINLGRMHPSNINLNDRRIEHSKEGKVLGLKITPTGFATHARYRQQIAKVQLAKLKRFRNLSQNNKRNLYIALVRSKLLYPIIPLHIMSRTQIIKMQRIQNEATRFITNTFLSDRIRSEDLHTIAELEPINKVLHNQANRIWKTIQDNFPEEVINRFALDEDQNYMHIYPSSLRKAMEPMPEGIFV